MPSSSAYSTNEFAPAPKVRRRYGDITDMTLWRWLRSENLGFPKPIYTNLHWSGGCVTRHAHSKDEAQGSARTSD
jgi:hypothetical protein